MGNRSHTRNKPFIVGVGGLQWGESGPRQLGALTATAVLDFPSIAANTTSDLTVAVAGAALGDAVQVGPPVVVTGLSFFGFVSAAGVVTVRAANSTAGAIDPAAATFRVVVSQF